MYLKVPEPALCNASGGKGKADAVEKLEGEGLVCAEVSMCMADLLVGCTEISVKLPSGLLGMVEGLDREIDSMEVHV